MGEDVGAILDVIDGLQRRLLDLRRGVHRDIRARELTTGLSDLLTCHVGAQIMALPLRHVETVVMRCEVTKVPETPPWVLGMVDFHGDGMPVLDLRARLLGEVRDAEIEDMLVICSTEHGRVALAVQGVSEVRHGATLEVRDEVDHLAHASYVLGVTYVTGAQLLVLSVPQLVAGLSLPEEPTT